MFRKQKRLDLWLKVAAEVAQHHPDVYFLLVGDGPERPMVERLSKELGLAERVILPGLRSPILPYLAACDIYFMSSDFEGLPVAMLEAMACGVPVVTTSAGGIEEVISDSSLGLTSPVGDVDSLIAHLRHLVTASEEARELGLRGRARVERSFSLKRMTENLESLYAHLVPPPRPRREVSRDYLFGDDVRQEEALDLIKRALGSGSERTPRSPEFFSWKHKESPFGSSLLFGARTGATGELVGLRAFQRWKVARPADGLALNAVRAVDTSTHPEHQRKGLFTGLTGWGLERFASEGGDLVFNTPNSNSLPGYLKMGWEVVAEVPVRMKWLSVSPDRAAGDKADSWESVLGTDRDRELWNGFLEGVCPQQTLSVEKSWDYLRWRYTGHPTVNYSFKARFQDGSPVALVVWCRTSRARFTELAVCELFYKSVDEGAALLQSILQRRSSHYAVSCFHNTPGTDEILGQLGFYSLPSKSVILTSLPLDERAFPAVHAHNWSLTTGDLQIF